MPSNDLLTGVSDQTYDATSIEVLEGLEPVRKRARHVYRRHR